MPTRRYDELSLFACCVQRVMLYYVRDEMFNRVITRHSTQRWRDDV